MSVGKSLDELGQVHVASDARTRPLHQPTDGYCQSPISICTKNGIPGSETGVFHRTERAVPIRTGLPHRDDALCVPVSTQSVIPAKRSVLVAQNVPGHRTVGLEELDCFAVPAVRTPVGNGAGGGPVCTGIQIQRQCPALG